MKRQQEKGILGYASENLPLNLAGPISASVNLEGGIEHHSTSRFPSADDDKINGCARKNSFCIPEIVKENAMNWDY